MKPQTVLALVAIGTVATYFVLRQRAPAQPWTPGTLRAVPEVAGLTAGEAVAFLMEQGFAVVGVDPVLNPTVAPETVLAITPPPGTMLTLPATVRLTIAVATLDLGPMPALVGMTEVDAETRLADLALLVLFDRHTAAEVAGIVIGQAPPPGTLLHYGDSVTVEVSLGP